MKPVSSLYSRILPHVPGAPDPFVKQAVVDAAIRFCGLSEAIIRDLDPITTAPGVSAYELDLPPDTMVARVLRVAIDGTSLLTGVPAQYHYDDMAPQGSPRYYSVRFVDDELSFVLWPVPSKAHTLTVRAALKPTPNANQLPDDLVDWWGDAIVSGALASLMLTPSQPFTNPELAAVHERMFYSGIKQARVEAYRSRVVGSMTVNPLPFA